MKGIIFDLDGTMVDNMMIHHRAWQKTLQEIGCKMSLEEVIENMHGVNEEALERLFGDRFSDEERLEISHRKEALYRSVFLPNLRLINGLEQFINNCVKQQIPMAVATAAPKVNLDYVLDNLEIRELFKATFHSGSVSSGKPDPEVFLKSANALGLDPEECLVFEDSPTGIKTANNAGMGAIAITTTHPQSDFEGLEVQKFIQDYTEINISEIQRKFTF